MSSAAAAAHSVLFFLNGPPPTETSPLPLHDALPISSPANPPSAPADHPRARGPGAGDAAGWERSSGCAGIDGRGKAARSEEHTSELQSRQYLVCRLLLEKKKKQQYIIRKPLR